MVAVNMDIPACCDRCCFAELRETELSYTTICFHPDYFGQDVRAECESDIMRSPNCPLREVKQVIFSDGTEWKKGENNA